MGPCTASLMLLLVQSVYHGSLYGLPIAAVSIATLCLVPLSGLLTLLVVSIFVIGHFGCCNASHCCCLSTATKKCGSHTLVFGP
ncbi:unnamed protein product [Staurois parvus]|uniref:Uncharacterized protein n=1 Tax=Staurois parvus TaxID=386267 RepID=A0ABN9CMB3_9NEOB|nr:unnamed protein product [Staurois parvus]